MINGYVKWLSSTKFQISITAIGLIFIMIPLFELAPAVAAKCIVEIVITYCVARELGQIIEVISNKVKKIKDLKNEGYEVVRKIRP